MLSPQEEQRLREKIRKELEQAEAERQRRKQLEEEEKRRKQIEAEKQRIILEEQEKFYKERGLQKYVNHYGRVEWLTPEEIEARKKVVVRRRKSHSHRSHSTHSWRFLDLVLLILVVVVGLGVTFYLTRNIRPHSDSYGSLRVSSNVEGAALFIDGKLSGVVTDGVITEVKPGTHIISVAKPGYIASPSQIEVEVKPGKSTEVAFELKRVE